MPTQTQRLPFNIILIKDADYSTVFTLQDDTGAAIDLTNGSLTGFLKRTKFDSVIVATPGLVIDPDQVTNKGKLTFSFTGAQTGGFDFGNELYYYRAQFISSGLLVTGFTDGFAKLKFG